MSPGPKKGPQDPDRAHWPPARRPTGTPAGRQHDTPAHRQDDRAASAPAAERRNGRTAHRQNGRTTHRQNGTAGPGPSVAGYAKAQRRPRCPFGRPAAVRSPEPRHIPGTGTVSCPPTDHPPTDRPSTDRPPTPGVTGPTAHHRPPRARVTGPAAAPTAHPDPAVTGPPAPRHPPRKPTSPLPARQAAAVQDEARTTTSVGTTTC
jgi:hypothetical protein